MTNPEKKEARSGTRNLVRVLTRDQILLLKEFTEKNGIGLLFQTALCTGLRQGELLSLRWQDMDMESRVLSIQRTVSLFPKSDFLEREIQPPQQRSIKLPAVLVQQLQQHHQAQHEERQRAGKKWAEKHLIFPDERGNYLSPFHLRRRFQQALEDANLPATPFHAVRHTTISLLLMLGVEPQVVQAMLGVRWCDTVTVSITPIALDQYEDAIRKILDFLGKEDK